MNCRGCGKDLVEGDDYRMVAEWPFCPPCFEELMKGHAKPAQAKTEEPPEAARSEPAAGPATVPCSVCKRQLGPEEGKKLGIWTFCPECYGELKSFAQAYSPEEETAAENGAPGKDAEEEPEGGIAGVAIGLAGYVTCTKCGRRIPQGGSRSLDGASLCPDCYYAAAREAEQRAVSPGDAPADAAKQPGSEAPPGTGDQCACCGRPLRAGFFDEVEGFTLCRACLSTDANLAVRIARERHRKLLESIRQGL